MNKDDPVLIERTANGYIVRPMTQPHMAVCILDTRVFQTKGWVSSDGKADATLFGWLDSHFSGENS